MTRNAGVSRADGSALMVTRSGYLPAVGPATLPVRYAPDAAGWQCWPLLCASALGDERAGPSRRVADGYWGAYD
jgi:hypothetical protein